MADYLDRDALLDKLEERFKQLRNANMEWDEYVKGFGDALDIVEYFDPADVVEVVRCKECKYGDLCYPVKEIGEDAIPSYYCYMYDRYMSVNGYCGFGAKMDGNHIADVGKKVDGKGEDE